MTPDEVGEFRYCPACARFATAPEYGDVDDLGSYRCSCCDRPRQACPCSPVEEGECTAVHYDTDEL